jgi:hypothetical protein
MYGRFSQPHPTCAAQTRARKQLAGMRVGWLLRAAVTLSACTGQIETASQGNPTAGPSIPGEPGKPADGTPKPTEPGGLNCSGSIAAPAPLARLTNLEYRNTLNTLFTGVTMPEVDLPADNVVEGFDNNSKAQTPAPALIQQYRVGAQSVGAAASQKLDVLLPCKPASSAEQDSCGKQWIDSFAPRAYRRPITTEERTRLHGLFTSAKSSYDFPTAISLTVQAVLQSPYFLYRIETGKPAANGVAKLTGYEMASRLSYFFWDNMPDQQLIAAAESGKLETTEGVEDQARRLLDDPQAQPAVANLFRQWLRFDKMDRMEKDAMLFPGWNEGMADSLRASAEKFVERSFWETGSLKSLLTDNSAYVDAAIASIYGVQAPAADGGKQTLVATDASQRSGILTQAGLMAAFAHTTTDSPVLRGVFVLDRLLCSAPPPPPPNVTGSIEEEKPGSAPRTTRERFAQTHEQGDCASCHHVIDGFGFGFSHYDAVGKWRETENGIAVDATGWIDGTRDINGTFDGAVELGQRLAQSAQVSDCVASQWYRYSLGLGAADVKACDVVSVKKSFTDSSGDLRELMVATVTSDAFRSRPEVIQ